MEAIFLNWYGNGESVARDTIVPFAQNHDTHLLTRCKELLTKDDEELTVEMLIDFVPSIYECARSNPLITHFARVCCIHLHAVKLLKDKGDDWKTDFSITVDAINASIPSMPNCIAPILDSPYGEAYLEAIIRLLRNEQLTEEFVAVSRFPFTNSEINDRGGIAQFKFSRSTIAINELFIHPYCSFVTIDTDFIQSIKSVQYSVGGMRIRNAICITLERIDRVGVKLYSVTGTSAGGAILVGCLSLLDKFKGREDIICSFGIIGNKNEVDAVGGFTTKIDITKENGYKFLLCSSKQDKDFEKKNNPLPIELIRVETKKEAYEIFKRKASPHFTRRQTIAAVVFLSLAFVVLGIIGNYRANTVQNVPLKHEPMTISDTTYTLPVKRKIAIFKQDGVFGNINDWRNGSVRMFTFVPKKGKFVGNGNSIGDIHNEKGIIEFICYRNHTAILSEEKYLEFISVDHPQGTDFSFDIAEGTDSVMVFLHPASWGTVIKNLEIISKKN